MINDDNMLPCGCPVGRRHSKSNCKQALPSALPMRALTLIQPMAASIVFDHPLWKDIENRPRDLPRAMRGVETTIALHAGLKWDDGYGMFVEDMFGGEWPPFAEVLGAVIGLVTFSGRVFTSEADCRAAGRSGRWFVGEYGYEIKSRVALREPVPCKGALGFWKLPDDVERQVREQLGERAA